MIFKHSNYLQKIIKKDNYPFFNYHDLVVIKILLSLSIYEDVKLRSCSMKNNELVRSIKVSSRRVQRCSSF